MIKATARKDGEYYRAVLIVLDGEYRQEYRSSDMFVTRKTAQRQAEWWRHESIELGQVTTA